MPKIQKSLKQESKRILLKYQLDFFLKIDHISSLIDTDVGQYTSNVVYYTTFNICGIQKKIKIWIFTDFFKSNVQKFNFLGIPQLV